MMISRRYSRASLAVDVAIAMLIIWTPRIGAACAVCMTGREDANRVAFELMTAFMTITPFLLIGGVIWWLPVVAILVAIRNRLRVASAAH